MKEKECKKTDVYCCSGDGSLPIDARARGDERANPHRRDAARARAAVAGAPLTPAFLSGPAL